MEGYRFLTLAAAAVFLATSAPAQAPPPNNSGAWKATYDASKRSAWATAPLGILDRPSDPTSNTVSLHELDHAVPRKAAREMEKAEKARQKNNVDEAIEHLKRAIDIDPEYVGARNNLAALLLRSGKADAAVGQLEQAVQMDPHSPIPFSNLAVAYLLLHRFDDAERTARRSVDLDRTGLRPRLILGLTLMMQQKMTDEALLAVERAEPDYPQAHLLAARILLGRGEFSQAKGEISAYLGTGDQAGAELARHWLHQIKTSDDTTSAAALR